MLSMVTPGVMKSESPSLSSIKYVRIVGLKGALEVTSQNCQTELGFPLQLTLKMVIWFN